MCESDWINADLSCRVCNQREDAAAAADDENLRVVDGGMPGSLLPHPEHACPQLAIDIALESDVEVISLSWAPGIPPNHNMKAINVFLTKFCLMLAAPS